MCPHNKFSFSCSPWGNGWLSFLRPKTKMKVQLLVKQRLHTLLEHRGTLSKPMQWLKLGVPTQAVKYLPYQLSL